MKRLASCSLVALALLLCVKLPARAAEHEGGAQGGKEPSIFWEWANFALLAGGLGYLVKKHAGPYFAQRSLEIRKGMAEADAARAASDAKVAEVDRRLANLQAEIEAMRRNAQQEAEADAQRARGEAAAEMAKVELHLKEEIASATKSGTLELRRHSAELALGLAETKIAARLSPEMQNRLVGRFVATMLNAASGARRN
jgi:F-type H+-transporting ATPase subunit b